MKNFLLSLALSVLLFTESYAQNPFLGVQNGTRKGMVSALMNPAEISTLPRKIEINLFSVQGALSNDVLSYSDVLAADDLLNLATERATGPMNVRADVAIQGPAVGFSVGKWGFGVATLGNVKADVLDLDPSIADALLGSGDGSLPTGQTFTSLSSNYPQRIMATGWSELNFLAGREIFQLGPHHLAAGANLRLLLPTVYGNVGLSALRTNVIEENGEVYLGATTGQLGIAYSDPNITSDFGLDANTIGLRAISGVAVDLGANYRWVKGNGKTFLHGGLALKNLGRMSYKGNPTNRLYTIDIPDGERFRIDNLEGDFDQIENQLVESGYFTVNSNRNELTVSLPTLLTLYGEIRPVSLFQASVFMQRRLSDESIGTTITAQNVICVTPRLVLGTFQIYSPWAHYQVSGLTGGLGIQIGGFFIGSNGLITGTLSDSRHADFHMGFSFGVGKR